MKNNQKSTISEKKILTLPLGLTIITSWGVCANINLVFERVWGAPTKRDPEAEMVRWRDGQVYAMSCSSGFAWLLKWDCVLAMAAKFVA